MKLTKKYLMSLGQGCFLVSNCLSRETSMPLIYEKVESLEGREEQWKKIKEVSANARECHVFQSRAEAENWLLTGMAGNISKLTKEMLMGLPRDAVLVSDRLDLETKRPHVFFVSARGGREQQWQEIKASSADNISCWVFTSFEDAKKSLGIVFEDSGQLRTVWDKAAEYCLANNRNSTGDVMGFALATILED